MRQEQGEAGHAPPLGFPRADELVNDDLRTVAEIAELAFPNGQAARLGGRESVFESHDSLFGQHRIGHRELWLIRRDVLQRHVRSARGLVVQYGIAMKKSAPPALFPADPLC